MSNNKRTGVTEAADESAYAVDTFVVCGLMSYEMRNMVVGSRF